MDFPKKYRDNVLNAERNKEEISIQNRFETAMEKVCGKITIASHDSKVWCKYA